MSDSRHLGPGEVEMGLSCSGDAIVKMVAEEAGWYICVVGIWVHKERLGRNAPSRPFHAHMRGRKVRWRLPMKECDAHHRMLQPRSF